MAQTIEEQILKQYAEKEKKPSYYDKIQVVPPNRPPHVYYHPKFKNHEHYKGK